MEDTNNSAIGPFLNEEALKAIWTTLVSTFLERFDRALDDSQASLDSLGSFLELINAFVMTQPQNELSHAMMEETLPSVYLSVHLLPKIREVDSRILDTGKSLWTAYMSSVSQDGSRSESILAGLKTIVRKMLCDVSIIPT